MDKLTFLNIKQSTNFLNNVSPQIVDYIIF